MRSDRDGDAGEHPQGLPLAGVRILEFCHTVMGPACGLVLADFGADVTKVEPAPEGDRTRALQGFQVGSFSYFNRNKKSIGINLKEDEGRRVAHRLVRQADVLIENYGPGAADRLGIGYQTLKTLNPRLIYCSLKGYLPGPYGMRAALDEVVQFQAGLAFMTGPPGQPMRAGSSVVDIVGGMFGAISILAALRERDRTGVGTLVGASLFESAAFLVGQHMAGKAVTGIDPPPMPIKQRSWAIYETFALRNGEQIFLGLTSNAHWRAFCDVFGRPDLAAEGKYDTNEKRIAEHCVMKPIVQEIIARHTADDLIAMLAPRGIPIAKVAKPSDLFDDPQLNEGGLLETKLITGALTKLPALPVAIGGERLALRMNPPQLGQHTREILTSCGLSAKKIDELAAMKIIV